MENQKARKELDKAIVSLIRKEPFWASIVLKLKIKEDIKCPTAWTDGIHFGYNPDYVLNKSKEERIFLVFHEADHVFSLHPFRLRRMQKKYKGLYSPKTIHAVFNIAADYEANEIAKNAGHTLIPGALWDERYKDMCAERIFEIEIQKYEAEQDSPESGGEDGLGDSEGEGENPGESGKPKDSENEDGDSGKSGKSGKGKGKEKSKNNENSGNEDEDGNGDSFGEVRIPKDENDNELTEEELQKLEQEWKQSVQQAILSSQKVGKLPGNIERIAKILAHDPLPWQGILQEFVQNSAKSDYSWSRLSRRGLARGEISAGIESEELPPIHVILDVSGSISDEDIGKFNSELNNILDQWETTLKVVYFDTQVQNKNNQFDEFSRDNYPVKLKTTGGGGTDFRVPFAWLKQHEYEPITCVVFITDGECYSYPKAPPYPVLWIGTGREFKPPFGQLTLMNPPRI